MKLLFLTPQPPYPPRKGTAVRNYYLMQAAARRHEVHLLTFAPGPLPAEVRSHLSGWCASVQAIPTPQRSLTVRIGDLRPGGPPDLARRLWTPRFAATLAAALQQQSFNLVQVEGLELAPYLATPTGDRGQAPLWLLDEHNCEYALQASVWAIQRRRPVSWPGALYSLAQSARLQGFERWACLTAHGVLVVSEEDSMALRALDSRISPWIIPNGIDCDYYAHAPPPESAPASPDSDLLFVGTLDYRPNADAVEWLLDDIMPAIWRELPGTRLRLVGPGAAPRLRARAGPRLRVEGEVPDVRPYLAGTKLVVTPLRMGGGVRFKALEAMAARVPIVATPAAMTGIPVRPGTEVEVAARAGDFAARVVALLRDEPRRRALAAAALRLVSREFDWPVVATRIEEAYASLGAHAS
ncbi:MAG: glycosyltransferase [Chloroflexi bacterium]|nr:glycosyltransferase [Chloroflexota bacterium]